VTTFFLLAGKWLTKGLGRQIDVKERGWIRLLRGWNMIPYWSQRWGSLRGILGEL